MGSEQSTRSLTISNEEEVGVIKVSSAVVERLAQGVNKNSNQTVKEVNSFTPTPAPPPPQPTPSNAVPQSSPLPQKNIGETPSVYSAYYYPELTLSALEMQHQKEKELRAQNDYWQKRLKNMENKHSMIDILLEEEYKRTVNEFYPIEKGQKATNNLDNEQLCAAGKEKVLKCYQDHPKETLKCSNLVEEFSNCVDQRRMNLITTR
ncbi:PREDICTED: MICOS complex subunit mic25-a [Polistes dominula]|uniref:MICOS complex subunit mic25-a n=1 Tax=Polistes dominula TaxID=743375 RepID=A0ABM1HVN2_POLDO|nr:PREDICTED: MICOS complex subunit mic25-a [Polistes dominula]XP_015172019.1 PREDICTED: MICOS complex subunit mic25-a [Polistes dominula]XP_015172020.1 PREDICTED: MICOS complex subunit mic25-a [Polistes dominula]